MIICKICNPTLQGNGYCGEHSTSGFAYLFSELSNPNPAKNNSLKFVKYGCICHKKDEEERDFLLK